MKKISDAKRETLKIAYHQKGYILVRNFFSDEEVTHLKSWIQEIINWPVVKEKWLKYFEALQDNTTTLSRVENFVNFHPKLKQLIEQRELIELLSLFMGEPVLFFKEKLNLKPPGARGYTPHQDAPAFFDIDYDAITWFTALDPSTVKSGCLYFSKDGKDHVECMLKQNDHNHALSQEVVNNIYWEPIECNPGDVIIFSSYAPHYSTENKSAHERKALFFTYGKKTKTQNKTKQYYEKKRKIFPQDSEKIPGFDYTKAAKIYSYSSPVIININQPRKRSQGQITSDFKLN